MYSLDQDCLTILCQQSEGVYRVWSDTDECVYTMRTEDLEHERVHNKAEIDGHYD